MVEHNEAQVASNELDTAWRRYYDGIEALRSTLHSMTIARSSFDHVAADRWLLQSQAAAHNLVLAPDPRHPRFLLHHVFDPNVYSWLLPNADFVYRYAFVDGRGTYRIRGMRRSAYFVDIQMISGFWGDPGMRLMDSYDFDALGITSGSRVDLYVGPERPDDGSPWIRTDPASERNTLIVREAFYDWEKEARSSLRIVATEQAPRERRAPDAQEVACRLDAALRMIRFCHETFSGGLTAFIVESVGYNRFLLLDTSHDEDAANPAAGYVPMVFDLDPTDALVIEFDLPDASYWGLQVGDIWWQAADYVDHQSSLNGRQIEVDPDARVRVVLCGQDPGVANWLDTTGFGRGVALLRWYRADRHPVPEVTRMPIAEVGEFLPAKTSLIEFAERRRRMAARREEVLSRYDD